MFWGTLTHPKKGKIFILTLFSQTPIFSKNIHVSFHQNSSIFPAFFILWLLVSGTFPSQNSFIFRLFSSLSSDSRIKKDLTKGNFLSFLCKVVFVYFSLFSLMLRAFCQAIFFAFLRLMNLARGQSNLSVRLYFSSLFNFYVLL